MQTLLLVGFLMIAFFLVIIGKFYGVSNEVPPYYRKPNILNGKEQVLFYRLVEAMPDYHVLAQVRLADIVGVNKCKNWQTWFNKVSRKSVDFVICDKSFAVLACVELDGKTHQRPDRQKADASKDNALQISGIPLVRIEASKIPSAEYFLVLLDQARRSVVRV